jgi:predicted RNA-binding Zn-ribbon protein involved in translation (DUF1610 family)
LPIETATTLGGGPTGAFVGQANAPVEPIKTPAEAGAAFCTNCGAKINSTAFFCVKCGKKIERAAARTPAATPVPQPNAVPSAPSQPAPPPQAAPSLQPAPPPQAAPPLQPAPPSDDARPGDAQTLRAAVDAAISRGSTEDVKTVGFYNLQDTEPTVGWLVCVRGAYVGQSFVLKTGRNNIGRALDMDIALAKETGVSRNKHAVVTYEPLKKEFFIQPGDGNGLTYVNDELLMTFAPLKAYDKITMGSSEYIFVAFCNEQFTWDDYI